MKAALSVCVKRRSEICPQTPLPLHICPLTLKDPVLPILVVRYASVAVPHQDPVHGLNVGLDSPGQLGRVRAVYQLARLSLENI